MILYGKLKNKINLLLPSIGMLAFICILVGSYFQSAIIIKFLLMTIGFDLILAIRDPIEVYATDVLLKNTETHEQQKAISYLQLSRRIGETIISLLFSLILLKLELIYVIICLFVFGMISLRVNTQLYKMIRK